MRTLTTILAVVLLMASVGQAAVLLDLGWRVPPVNPETDGNYWNSVPREHHVAGEFGPATVAWVAGAWTLVGELNDHTGSPAGVWCETKDVPNSGGNNAPTTTGYPANAEIDWWNGGNDGATAAVIRMTNLNDAKLYDVNIRVWYPSDPWVYGGGIYTIGGVSHTYHDAGAVIYSWTNVSPSGGNIDLSIIADKPVGETRSAYNGISLIELIPEPATLSLLALGGLAVIRRRR